MRVQADVDISAGLAHSGKLAISTGRGSLSYSHRQDKPGQTCAHAP